MSQLTPEQQAMHQAVAYHQAGRLDLAEQLYRAVLAKNPNQADALNLLGVIADTVDQQGPAVELISRAISLAPREPIMHVNLAAALANLGQYDDAIASLRKAIALDPKLPTIAYLNLAALVFLQGNFAEGWQLHEHGRRDTEMTAPGRVYQQPWWRGENPDGKTILIYTEQGLGDAMHFVRYALLLRALGARVLLGCPPDLARLFRSSPELGEVIVSGQSPPMFDFHCPIMSLPSVFKTELHSIPAPIPYLHAEPELVEEWRKRLGPLDGKLRVGLVWAGQPIHKNDRRRSMKLAGLAPLAAIKGVRFYSLQKGPAAEQAEHPPAGMDLSRASDQVTDLAETAALMMHLDLIIGVDTGPMHLAGALGRPIWMMVPMLPDFRWLLDREDSPWYPTLRLFRQKTAGDWPGVVQKVAEALAGLAGAAK